MAKRTKKPAQIKTSKKFKAEPKRKAEPVKGKDGVVRLPPAGKLDTLITQLIAYGKQAKEVSGDKADLLRDYVEKHGVHRKALSLGMQIEKVIADDTSAAWLLLAHFDHIRKVRDWDKRVKEQGQLLPAIPEATATQAAPTAEQKADLAKAEANVVFGKFHTVMDEQQKQTEPIKEVPRTTSA